jgi:hypothetical protein
MAAVLTVGLSRPPMAESPALLVEEFESVPLFGD